MPRRKAVISPCIQAQRHHPQEQAFEMLKQELTLAPLLAYEDHSKPFWVYTDWSLQGLGAVLAQYLIEVINNLLTYLDPAKLGASEQRWVTRLA